MRNFGATRCVGALAVAALWTAAVGMGHADPATLPNWQPDPAQVAQLTDQDTVTVYTIQIPKGAQGKHQEMDLPTGVETQFVWTAGKNLDILATVTSPKDPNTAPDPAAALDTFERTTVDTCSNVVRSKKEVGNVDGLTVTRDHFSFTSPDSSHTKMVGFNYAVKAGSTLVLAGALTADSSKATDLPLAEAAVLTLLKSVAKNQ